MSVQTLVLILKKNLENLTTECRKYPIILDAVKNTRIALGRITNLFGLKENESIILKPFLLCLEHSGGNVKVLSPCMNCIQELIKHECIKIIGVNIILDMFLRLSPPLTLIKVKILQILLTALTTQFYEVQMNQMILGKILTICTTYFVRSDPNSVLNGTSIVVMKQSINIIFTSKKNVPSNALSPMKKKIRKKKKNTSSVDNIKEEEEEEMDEEDRQEQKMKPIRLALLQDLCNFVERATGKWIKVKLTPTTPISFFLDTLEEILVSHAPYLQADDDYILILKGNIFSTLLNGFNDDRDAHFPEIYRIYRICVVILKMVLFSKKMRSQCVEILKHLTSQILNQKSKMWKRVLALEVYRRFAEDHTMFIQSILRDRNYYESKEVIVQILDAITAYILRAKERGVKLGKFQYSTNKGKRLETEGGRVSPFTTGRDEFECMTLVLDTLIGSISSLNILVMSGSDEFINKNNNSTEENKKEELEGEQEEGEEEEEEQQQQQQKGQEDVKCVRKIVEIEWTNILKSINFLLESCREPDTIQRVLQVYFLFTNTCGAIEGLSSVVRDSFLSSLLKYVTRVQSGEHLQKSRKSQMIIQILFDVANSQGSKYLGSSWFILLKNFHEIYGIILRSIYHQQTNQSPSSPNSASTTSRKAVAAVGRTVASLTTNATSSKRGRATSGPSPTQSLPKIFRLILHRLENLFRNKITARYPLNSFTQLLKAVIGLSRESLSKVSKKKQRLKKMRNKNRNKNDLSVEIIETETKFEPYSFDHDLFFAKKFFLLLEWNSERIGEIFKSCSESMEHIRYLSTHPSMQVKKFVVSKIFQLLITIFSKKSTTKNKETSTTTTTTLTYTTGEIEKMLFGVLSDSNDYSNELEESIILCIPSLIENASPHLTTSWPLILRFLRARNAKLIHSAFGTVQLIANQFLSELGKAGEAQAYLKDFIKTLSFFGEQNYVEDLNVSLGAISLFLPVFDHLSSTSLSLRRRKKEESEDSSSSLLLEEQMKKSDDMIFFFFKTGLSGLMKDRKEEKRNSTLKYFFDMASPLSDAFCSLPAKQKFLEDIFFPCLHTLVQRRNQSSFISENSKTTTRTTEEQEQEEEQEEQEKKKKKNNKDFVHHSRDTHVKQWDNTLSQTLMNVLVKFIPSNSSGLLNAHPKLGGRVFQTVLEFVQKSVLESPQQQEEHNNKVIQPRRQRSGVQSVTFQQLLRNALTCPLPILKSRTIPGEFQRLVWTSLSESVWVKIVSTKNWSDEHLNLRFLQGILEILKKNPNQNIFHPFILKNNNEEEEKEELDCSIINNFIKKILKNIVISESFQSRKIRDCLLQILIRFVEIFLEKGDDDILILINDFFLDSLILPKPEGIYIHLNKHSETHNNSIIEIPRKKYLELILGVREDAMINIIQTFIQKIYIPIQEKQKHNYGSSKSPKKEDKDKDNNNNNIMEYYFVKVIKKLGTLMLLRYVSAKRISGELWRYSITAFDIVVRNYIKNITTTTTTTWNIMCLIIEDFLFAYYKHNHQKEQIEEEEEGKEEELMELKLIRLLGDLLLHDLRSSFLSGENKTYVLSLLEKSTFINSNNNNNKNIEPPKQQRLQRFRLFEESINVLFSMISVDSMGLLCELVLPVLRRRCTQILKKYLADMKEVEAYGPLESFRRLEVLHIMKILKTVKVFVQVDKEGNKNNNNKKNTIKEIIMMGGKSILMELFPLLCEFVMVEDKEIRRCLLELNREVCSYLHLNVSIE